MIGRKFMAVMLIVAYMALVVCLVFVIVGCKPSLPKITDYPEKYPCYAYDKCKVMQAYGSKDDCKIEMQKCFIYVDMEKCKDDDVCWKRTGIRY